MVLLVLIFLLCTFGLQVPFFTFFSNESESFWLWLIELLSHWQWLFILGLAFTIPLLIVWSRKWFWLLGALLGLLPLVTAPKQMPLAKTSSTTAKLKIINTNVHFKNENIGPLLSYVKKENPDLLFLIENNPRFTKRLEAKLGYPYKVLYPREGFFGLGLFSKFPIWGAQLLQDRDQVPRLEFMIRWKSQVIHVCLIHPMAPIAPHYHHQRNNLIQMVGREANKRTAPSLIIGDFNATPWSTGFFGLESLGLTRMTSLKPTWPSFGKKIFGIPIDHALATSHFLLFRSEVGPYMGSDHFPILLEVGLKD